MKIPNKVVQSLLNFCLPAKDIDLIKRRIESTVNREFAVIGKPKPPSFYEPLVNPCYYQYQNTSRILSSDGNRILCYDLNMLNASIFKDPVFISLDKEAITEKWMLSIANNRSKLELGDLILSGTTLPAGNIFEVAINSQLMDIKQLIEEDFVEVDAQYLLDAINAAIVASNKEPVTIKISTEGGRMVLFQGGKVVGVVMGLN